jgi:hypothetical protein
VSVLFVLSKPNYPVVDLYFRTVSHTLLLIDPAIE